MEFVGVQIQRGLMGDGMDLARYFGLLNLFCVEAQCVPCSLDATYLTRRRLAARTYIGVEAFRQTR